MISYCLINRKSRRCSQLNGNHTRATLPVMRQMGNSNSIGMYRAGLNGSGLADKPDAVGLMDHHLTHPSSQGPPSSAVAAPLVAANNGNNTNNNISNGNHVAYSSSTGSHSLSGTSAGTPGSMLLANTMVQVLPPDGSGYPLLKPNGHHHHHQSQPPPPHSTYDPYNSGHMSNGIAGGAGSSGAGGMMFMPTAYRDFQA